MKVATWNVNSVRHRIGLVTRFLRAQQPDVLALQETKVINELFPAEPLSKLGYVHQAIHGQKAYHGVAILSRLPFQETATQDFCREGHARHIQARFENGLELHNFYVPAGGDIPDPALNPKFAHKLDFVAAARDHFAKTPKLSRSILVGDLNIAPLEHDVWSHKQLLKIVSHTPEETKLHTEWQETCWYDSLRHFVPENQKLYTWWSYRAKDWEAADKGRRLDHVWVTHDLKGALRRHEILKEARGWTQASDHVPVLVELAL
jgi:exodeoxyribonuclease-3